jgi:hypothetical protein
VLFIFLTRRKTRLHSPGKKTPMRQRISAQVLINGMMPYIAGQNYLPDPADHVIRVVSTRGEADRVLRHVSLDSLPKDSVLLNANVIINTSNST